MSDNLHSFQRHLITLRIEHADIRVQLERANRAHSVDELALRRLKKKHLSLRDQITRLEHDLAPREPA